MKRREISTVIRSGFDGSNFPLSLLNVAQNVIVRIFDLSHISKKFLPRLQGIKHCRRIDEHS